MDRQRLTLFVLIALAFTGTVALFFSQTWTESRTRFRAGLPVPRDIVPKSLFTEEELMAGSPPVAPDIRTTDPLIAGTATGSVTVIVFGDFQSDLTHQQHTAILRAVSAVGERSVRVIWRDLPNINEHSKAMRSAVAARCAGAQGAFKAMHDLILNEASTYDDLEFLRFSRRAGVEEQAFLVCMRDPAIEFAIRQDMDDAAKHAITEIPTTFVNSQPFTGFVDEQTLTAVLRNELRTEP